MEHRLTLPFKRPPLSANDQRRSTWHQVRARKKEVSDAVYLLAKQQRISGLGPSIVTVRWFAPDRRRRDVDGLGPFLKAALDGLSSAGAWVDDNSDHVVEARLAIDKTQTSNPRIEILIHEG